MTANNDDGQILQFTPIVEITPAAFIQLYNHHSDGLRRMTTAQINKLYHIKDADGSLYKFSRTRNGPQVIRNYTRKISKDDLHERITIIETRLKEIDFLCQRIRDLEELLFKLRGEVKFAPEGLKPKAFDGMKVETIITDKNADTETVVGGRSNAPDHVNRSTVSKAENNVQQSVCDKVQERITRQGREENNSGGVAKRCPKKDD